MRKLLNILVIAIPAFASAQGPSKKEREVLGNAKLLEETVFGSKDSLTIEKLFGTTVEYVHSSGKSQNRQEAISGIVNNKSQYTKKGVTPYNVSAIRDTMVVGQVYRADEKKADGTVSPLAIEIKTYWVQQSNQWKMVRRIASKAQEQ